MSRVSRIRKRRSIALRYDDGFRGAVASLPVVLLVIAAIVMPLVTSDPLSPILFIIGSCAALTLFSLVFMVWTHVLYTRAPGRELSRIAALQHERGPSRLTRLVGLGDTTSWTISGAAVSLIAAVSASVLGRGTGGIWLALLVLATAASSWASMVYAFALRYYRLHAAGEEFRFEIQEEPEFIDFVSMSTMISAVGALSGGSPHSRAGLNVVRTHTFLAFAFNALVVAMVVSLVAGLVAQ
ncbi:hypothetical protein GCM10028820_14620 [Tessaracoccus terricola]